MLKLYAHSFFIPFPLVTLVVTIMLVGGCDYARMKDDEAINSYQTKMPPKPAYTIPIAGGLEKLRTTDPSTLINPESPNQPSIDKGREAYTYYCLHCHGPKAEGYGTVGQSFAPLPANLKSTAVQRQSDGVLFYKVSLGYKRHPPMAATIAENDRWHLINYLRFLSDSSVKMQ